MSKITAIHREGGWADASAEYVVLPPGMDIQEEAKKRNDWYENEYLPAIRRGENPRYLALHDWLINLGAREPTKEELDIFFLKKVGNWRSKYESVEDIEKVEAM